MFRFFRILSLVTALLGILVAGIAGCNKGPVKPEVSSVDPVKKAEEHTHKEAGVHNGIIVAVGSDNYHAEAVFEKEGVVRFYTLGHDETKITEIDADPFTAFAKRDGAAESVSIVFNPEPQKDDKAGKTSQFVARLPRELWGQPVEVNIPTLRIGDERFRVPSFQSRQEAHHDDGMPEKVADEAERQLYTTPGGKYTAADIKANGNLTASQKFKGMMSGHNVKPQVGDKICPVSETKASAKFTWIVDGKPYEFCCPPCVDEFVKTAKEKPAEIKEPDTYIQK